MELRHVGLALRLAGPRAVAALAFVSLAVAGERAVGLAVSAGALAFTWWAVRQRWTPAGPLSTPWWPLACSPRTPATRAGRR